MTSANLTCDESVKAETNRAEPADTPGSRTAERFYRTLWRWHFWAGVMVAPVLIWAALTGAIYIFASDIEPWLYGSMMHVEPGSRRVSLDKQHDAAAAQFPGVAIAWVSISGEADRATEFVVKEDGLKHFVYVNPYTGEVTGKRIFQHGFFEIVRQLHRSMYAGVTGRVLMETATSWGIVLLLTGIYLWWPRKSGKAKAAHEGVWTIRLRKGSRLALRDLHAVCGMYLMPVAIVIMLTGLFFSYAWGEGFRSAVKATDSVPESMRNPPHSTAANGRTPVALQDVFDQMAASHPELRPIRIHPPKNKKHSYAAHVGGSADPTQQVHYVVDQYSGEVLAQHDFSSAPPLLKVRSFVYPLHVGEIFGLTTKLLALAACGVIVLSTITGVWMWWRSRPEGQVGLPIRSPQYRLRWIPVVLLCLVAMYLPMVAASVVVISLADWLVVRRFAGKAADARV